VEPSYITKEKITTQEMAAAAATNVFPSVLPYTL